ncbi:hypothetical protein AAVH_12155 [Aphelenchoides avenae]|nr:hypothetical protein AAVH_12155 [Aphelenchus avenae]
MVIIHRMTMAAISHYGLLAVNPRLLEGTRTPTTPPAVNRMALWQYQEHLLSRPGGLAELAPVHPDIMYGIEMPEMPWYVLQDAPPAPVKETQAGPLPDVPFEPYTAPDLRQPGVFMVNDQSDTSFEYLKRCNDHDRKPGIRYHATVRSVVDDWKKFETDSNATQDMIGFRRKLGNRTINSFGKMHLVCSASRFMRHHATQVAQFIDQVLNTWDRVQLERIVCQFFDNIRTLEVARGDKAFSEGKREERVERESIKFSKAEVLMALRWWVLRCEPGRAYFVENIHGPAWYDTAFLNSPGVDVGLRDSFRETLIGAFTDRLDHARLRYFLEEVTREHQAPQGPHGAARWPPWVLQYAVDFRRTYWSNNVVLMDQWAKTHFWPNLRLDVDAIELDSDPTQAFEAISRFFFGASVEQIVLFYGKDALDKGKARELWQFYPKVVDHLTRCFGRARVFIVTPAFIYYVMKEWKEAVKTAVIDNEDLQRLAGVVIHPTDLRLEAYFDQYGPEAGWPNETLALQDRNGTLLKAGVLQRKRRIVEEYGLELWTDEGLEPEFMLSEKELLEISRLSVGLTVRHFGVPTVPMTGYEERMPKPPKAREAKTLGGYPAILGGRTPAVRPDKGPEPAPPAKAKQPANVGLSLPWEQIKDLLLQENAKIRAEMEAELEALKAQRASALASRLEATQPTSTQKLGISVAPPPAHTPKPKGTPRPPAASKQQKGAKALNSPGFSPSSKSLAAGKTHDSTQGRRSEGPHALRQATTVRVAAAASLIAAPTSTTTSTTSAASTPSTTSTSSAATTGTSAATTGTSSGSSASGLPSSAESLPAARQPEEGDEAMPADDE